MPMRSHCLLEGSSRKIFLVCLLSISALKNLKYLTYLNIHTLCIAYVLIYV